MPGAEPCAGVGPGPGDLPMRCPTGELNGFPRRKSIATAAAAAATATATKPGNQLTATASAGPVT